MPTILDSKFWNKLSSISNNVGLKPADLLAVMYFESGLNPAAHNKDGNASGLIQFMPSILKNVGFSGDHSQFRELDANEQLDYVERYVNDKARLNNGSFKSATQYYVANLWPVALQLQGVKNEDPNTIIIEQDPKTKKYPDVSLSLERAAYKSNIVLDRDRDGKITYGDLDAVMQGVKQSKGYQNALATLSSGESYNVTQPVKSISNNTNMLAKVDNMLDKFMDAVANIESSNNLYKKAAYKNNFLPNNFLIKINSDNFYNSIEFARILCIALDEDLLSNSIIFSDNNNVEVETIIYGPKKKSIEATLQLCDYLSNIFEQSTRKIGACKINTMISLNKRSNYQELDIKSAQICYNTFHLKFIGT